MATLPKRRANMQMDTRVIKVANFKSKAVFMSLASLKGQNRAIPLLLQGFPYKYTKINLQGFN